MKHLKLFENFSEIIKVELSYERWMESYDFVNDYNGMGAGTLFMGDSGYVDGYEELIDRLKDAMKDFFLNNDIKVDVDKIDFINWEANAAPHPYVLETFIKGYDVSFY